MSAVITSLTDAQDLQVWDSSPAAAAPTWLPRRQTVAYRCGTHFDAVRAPVDIAQVVQDTFDLPGPVIANDSTLNWHFLIEPGLVPAEPWSQFVQVLRAGTVLGIPPASTHTGRDVRWVRLPGDGTTDPQMLRTALTGPPWAVDALIKQLHAQPPARTRPKATTSPETLPYRPTKAVLRVAAQVAAGRNQGQTADDLGVSPTTVRGHLWSLRALTPAVTPAGKIAALLAAGYLAPPVPALHPRDVDEQDLAVLRYTAELISRDALPPELRELPATVIYHQARLRCLVEAATNAQLIHLTWPLLAAVTPHATETTP